MKATEIIQAILTTHKECVGCKGRFQPRENIRVNIYNHAYCESCYKESEGES